MRNALKPLSKIWNLQSKFSMPLFKFPILISVPVIVTFCNTDGNTDVETYSTVNHNNSYLAEILTKQPSPG